MKMMAIDVLGAVKFLDGFKNDMRNIIKFNSDTKHRKQWFTGISFSHPAKMSLPLQLWLIDNFTKEGETILDPMAGSGTILVACSMGRNVITVELEDKFVQMQKGNWEKIQQRGCQLGYSMGTATIFQGDARNLTGILADKCIFSPPYAKTGASGKSRGSFWERLANDPTSARFGRERHPSVGEEYSTDPSNIGNLPYGEIDKIITSPPYAEAQSGGGLAKRLYTGKKGHSPNSMIGERTYMPETQGTSEGQISSLPYGSIDAVISSPPYEGSLDKPLKDGQSRGARGREQTNRINTNSKSFWQGGISENQANISNLKSDSYLSAMLQVYQQCYSVLKDGGLMVLVTKNFIRNKKQVGLDLDTIKLCEQAGFTFQNRWYRELQSQSFWRTIYYAKYPDVEPIKYEDVLVLKK